MPGVNQSAVRRVNTAAMPALVPGRHDRMRLVHRLAGRTWREGDGGPFAATVAEPEPGGRSRRHAPGGTAVVRKARTRPSPA
ncbi:hypothetical protein [Nonomuraea jabiensis]|uniref:hypothetical protein n=1 Tax=Nonomuraea jabiensis TaxID=882448 RepID=UPI0036C60B4E